jgi:hypothetical protein
MSGTATSRKPKSGFAGDCRLSLASARLVVTIEAATKGY